MIYLVISLLVSLIFIILGIRQYRAEKPVAINTGEKPPREDELTSVTEWNHRHGRNFIILGCVLFITLSIVTYFIEKLDGVALQVATVIFVIVIFAEIAWVGEYYGAAEPPVRCGESHLSGLTEPLHFVY